MNRLVHRIARMPKVTPTDHKEDVYVAMCRPLEILIVR